MSQPTKKITFTNKIIFGRGFTQISRYSDCIVARLMNNDYINMDGSLDKRDMGHLSKISRKALWLYIYYIYMHNRQHINLFKLMNKDTMLYMDKGVTKASAANFVKVIKKYLEMKLYYPTGEGEEVFSKLDLISFLDYIFVDYKDVLSIPFLENIYKKITQKYDDYNASQETSIRIMDKKIEELNAKNHEMGMDVFTVRDGEKFYLKQKNRNDPIAVRVTVPGL